MKIKIIDLLNKIYNYDDIPRKIVSDNHIWEYLSEYNDYKNEDNDYLFGYYITEYDDIYDFLSKEVEIIEEDKNIEKFDIESENGQYKLGFKSCSYSLNDINYIMLSKLNELIDEVNELKENK